MRIDGGDLSGKNSTAMKYAEAFPSVDGSTYEIRTNKLTAFNPFFDLAKYAFSKGMPEHLAKFLYYPAAIKDACTYRDDGSEIIQVSCVATRGLAYIKDKGIRDIFGLEKMVERLPESEHNFYLRVRSIDEIVRRLDIRRNFEREQLTRGDLLAETDPDRFIRREEILFDIIKQRFNPSVIFTDNMTPTETAMVISQSLCGGRDRI